MNNLKKKLENLLKKYDLYGDLNKKCDYVPLCVVPLCVIVVFPLNAAGQRAVDPKIVGSSPTTRGSLFLPCTLSTVFCMMYGFRTLTPPIHESSQLPWPPIGFLLATILLRCIGAKRLQLEVGENEEARNRWHD